MTPIQIGIIGLIIMVVLFALSVPVAVSMAVVGLAGFAYLVTPAAALNVLAADFYENFSSFSFTTMPMFVLMGSLCFHSNISKKLYDCAYAFLGNIRGGLALATTAACALFGAISGSSNAAAATMGKVALPEMKRYNYNDSLATASVAAGGCLDGLIPPSGVMVIYGIMTETSISKLFIGGIVPGILEMVFFMIAISIVCKRHPDYGPAGGKVPVSEKLKAIRGTIDMVILFVLVIGGMFFGWFTPMQAGAVGAAGAMLLGAVRRSLSLKSLLTAMRETVETTCLILAIVASATVFGHFMAVSTIPNTLAAWITGLDIPGFVVILFICFVYLVGGCFMDSLALMLLTVPIFFPVVTKLGYDPVWYGAMLVMVTGMGLITPPVGLNVYIIGNLAPDVPLQTIFKGVWPFLISMIVLTLVLLAWPGLVTWLPNLM